MVEPLILAHLIRDEDFTRKVLPFLKKEYFTTPAAKNLFTYIAEFVNTYKACPTSDALELSLNHDSLSGSAYTDTDKLLKDVMAVARVDSSRRQWLVDQTENFCKQRALYLAISESIERIDKDFQTAASVPGLLKEALGVGFHTNIGHDYLEDILQRFDFYHQNTPRIAFDLDLMNKITGGGLTPKTLNIVAAGTGIGKSLFLCHMAASTVAQGKNVLYITMEMAEERIAQRIDANLLDVTIDSLEQMSWQMYEHSFQNLRKQQQFGKLIIKEYPTSGGHVGHFRTLLDELALKKQFHPDLLIVDYINICSSVRFKHNGQMNSYTYVKAIAEELRGLAVEYNLPCLSATQLNREGFDSSDPTLTDTSESFGLPHTADIQIALVSNEQLDKDGLVMVKQLKNRYADLAKYRRFTLKVDRSKMKLYNDNNQQYLSDPLMTNTGGQKPNMPSKTKAKPGETKVHVPTVISSRKRTSLDSGEQKWKINF